MSYSATTGTELTRTEVRAATLAGVGIAILGLLALVFPFVTGLSLSILVGIVLVVGVLLGVNLLATGISIIRFGRGARQPVAQDVAQGNQS